MIHLILVVLLIAAAGATASHALLRKRDPRAAMGWIAVCVMFPYIGPILYILLGNNRIQTRARKLHAELPSASVDVAQDVSDAHQVDSADVRPEFTELARISNAITGQPLMGGNHIETLHNGEQAYPSMLASIDAATDHVLLATYIYETNNTGQQFADALSRARQRGVDVRILLDGVGELYAGQRAGHMLRKHGLRVARFLPPRLFPPSIHLNLRNHRKIMIVDSCTAYTGGMNIGDRHLINRPNNAEGVADMHFKIEGPVVRQLHQMFVDDWRFATHEELEVSSDTIGASGTAICRTIVDGPNEDHDCLAMVLAGAISAARQRVQIVTPYFLPPREMIAVMNAAALRGVDVSVILPRKSNITLVNWASRKLLWELLECGVRIYYQPPPFAHTKLFVVDEHYAQIGSANMDPRSLRLNFEIAVEIYDIPLARALSDHCDRLAASAATVTVEDMDARPLPVKLRDAAAWLFSPYL